MIGLLFKSEDTFSITGRGIVVTVTVKNGGPRPKLPLPVKWTDPNGADRESVVTGIEQFCNELGKPLVRQNTPRVGLLIKGIEHSDFQPGTMIYSDPDYEHAN